MLAKKKNSNLTEKAIPRPPLTNNDKLQVKNVNKCWK
nr:MAG TPA: hypothetical protein [Caudoviricetes sp.]DAZ56672.1 MAG TPA: hypothetical protein [Caudoviricetes sp.]